MKATATTAAAMEPERVHPRAAFAAVPVAVPGCGREVGDRTVVAHGAIPPSAYRGPAPPVGDHSKAADKGHPAPAGLPRAPSPPSVGPVAVRPPRM